MKVFPKNDDIRRILYHPTGVHFRKEGPADWPDDSYTHRRIADGDITVEEQTQQPDDRRSRRPKSET